MTPVSAVSVAIGTFAGRRFKTAHSYYAGGQLNTSVCPVAFTSSHTGTSLCSTGLVCQIPAPNVGVDREVEPKSCSHSSRHSRRFGRVGRCARSSLVGLTPVRQRQSGSASPAAPVRQRRSVSVGPSASVRDCAHMISRLRPAAVYNSTHAILLPIRPRSGPNPALKRNANSVARRPSSAGPCGPFCARCPTRHAVGVRLALR